MKFNNTSEVKCLFLLCSLLYTLTVILKLLRKKPTFLSILPMVINNGSIFLRATFMLPYLILNLQLTRQVENRTIPRGQCLN